MAINDMCVCDMYPPTLFTNAITGETKGIFLSMVLDYTRRHGIHWEYRETMGYHKMRFYLDRAHNPEKIIVIDWDKVKNIGTLYDAVARELDGWGNEIGPLHITMPPRHGKSPTAQMELYAALMKGENKMAEATNIYIRQDIESAARLAAAMREVRDRMKSRPKLPGIKNVHFSGPVTAVIWEDKTKTIVRCKDGEEPDYEKGLAMAIAKKALGTNKSGSNYYDIFKKWLPKPEEKEE